MKTWRSGTESIFDARPMNDRRPTPLVRRNEVVVLGSVSAGNHDCSVPGDY